MFDREAFRKLLIRARGNRTNADYAEESGVSRAYISGYVNAKIDSPPSPEILKRLANAAYNGVTYEDLMEAAGYIKVQHFADHTDYIEYDEDGNIVSVSSAFPNQRRSQQLDDRLRELLSDPDLRVAFHGLEDMTDEEKEGLITYLEAMKARRQKKGKD